MTVDNPKSSPITRAYLDAQKPLGGLPGTARERSLFEALQNALQQLYDHDLHVKCEQDAEDLKDEISKLERELDQIKAALGDDGKPEPKADTDYALDIVRERRLSERAGSIPPLFSKDEDRKRETTDILKQLAEECAAWRQLFDTEES